MENKKIKKIVREEMKNYVIKTLKVILFALIYCSSWAGWFYFYVTICDLEEQINNTIMSFVSIVMLIWFSINTFVTWELLNGD